MVEPRNDHSCDIYYCGCFYTESKDFYRIMPYHMYVTPALRICYQCDRWYLEHHRESLRLSLTYYERISRFDYFYESHKGLASEMERHYAATEQETRFVLANYLPSAVRFIPLPHLKVKLL
jgi:hypothetical protein